MGRSQQLPLAGLLLLSLLPSQLCTICEVSKENYSLLNPLISTMVNSKYAGGIQAANILLSLKLAGVHHQSLEKQLIQEAKYIEEKKESNLTSGQLALAILALRACQNPNESDKHLQLVSQLEEKFREEIEHMGVPSGNPKTNYYQLSLAVLALCLFNGSYSITELNTYFTPENKNFYFHGQFSVDTGAMAVLALSCVEKSVRQIDTNGEDLQNIKNYTESLAKKILSEKKENSLLGNAFSTGQAMQALFVSSAYYKEKEWNCQQTLDTVLEAISQGTFHLPIAAAQVLPALMGKTYLDVNNYSSCANNSGLFNSSTPEPTTPVEPTSPSTWISVNYTVQIQETFSIEVTVPKGSVFLNVMEEAQKLNYTVFRFSFVDSMWGPYITSVQGLEESRENRTYWQLLSGGEPLKEGCGNYVVHNGDYLEVRWSKY